MLIKYSMFILFSFLIAKDNVNKEYIISPDTNSKLWEEDKEIKNLELRKELDNLRKEFFFTQKELLDEYYMKINSLKLEFDDKRKLIKNKYSHLNKKPIKVKKNDVKKNKRKKNKIIPRQRN